MIARSWRATATPDGARRYDEHFRTAVLPELHTIPGFVSALLMRRDVSDEVHLHVLTVWESMDAIGAFAGDSPATAKVEPAAREALLRYDETVVHWDVVTG
jgi:heme-degrading monooxygenase HmoA